MVVHPRLRAWNHGGQRSHVLRWYHRNLAVCILQVEEDKIWVASLANHMCCICRLREASWFRSRIEAVNERGENRCIECGGWTTGADCFEESGEVGTLIRVVIFRQTHVHGRCRRNVWLRRPECRIPFASSEVETHARESIRHFVEGDVGHCAGHGIQLDGDYVAFGVGLYLRGCLLTLEIFAS